MVLRKPKDRNGTYLQRGLPRRDLLVLRVIKPPTKEHVTKFWASLFCQALVFNYF